MVVFDIFPIIMQDLDDAHAVRTLPDAMWLRQCTRAQQWVALRYQLLRETFPLSLYTNTPVYALAATHPRLVVITHITLNGTPLWPVPLASLRYKDTAWFATAGTPSLFYRIGWRFVGAYPVPSTNATALMSGLLLPATLTEATSRLQIPDSYVPQLIQVATGLLMLARERRYQEGVARIRQGLGIRASAGPRTSTQEIAGVTGERA